MNQSTTNNSYSATLHAPAALIMLLAVLLLVPFNLFSSPVCQTPAAAPTDPALLPDSIAIGTAPLPKGSQVVVDEVYGYDAGDEERVKFVPIDSIPVAQEQEWVPRSIEFSPDPTRAAWMAALCPGLGQLYNRRYWKLPLVVGGYLGLGYATSWNNGMLRDYTRAYADIMDNDPSTKSYMDFFPPTVKEEDLDHEWLTKVLQSRKNFYRRNRDLCIIGMVAVYLVAIVDAYVDASLAHFDISPDLSMDVYPSLMRDSRSPVPSIGLQWAFNF